MTTALSIAYEGSSGNTQKEMQDVLQLPDTDSRRASFAALYNNFNTNKEYEFSSANALWIQKDFPILDSYKSDIIKYYGAHAENVDFVNDYPAAKSKIDSWVSDNTRGKIDKIMPDQKEEDMIAITNAVYFKGKWVDAFKKSDTIQEEFRTTTGKTTAQMMHITKSFSYAETDQFQAVELPYKGNDLSMILVLPKQDVIPIIDQASYEALRKEMSFESVELSLPKFKLEETYNMIPTMKKLGIQDAFTPNADFSGMDGRKDLYIGSITHKTYVNVDEEGTEAAAATKIGMMEMSARAPSRPIVFKADHPFMFVIQEKSTGAIIFMGRLSDPS